MTKSTNGFQSSDHVPPVGAATYDGLLFRDNLASQGTIPAPPPYDQTPDIIGSQTAVADPQTEFSSVGSWATSYDCEPAASGETYYYLRCLNGAATSQTAKASLYCVPAQLILFPSTWTGGGLSTGAGSSTVEMSAASGHIAVGKDAFVMAQPPSLGSSTFYSFVAQAVAPASTSPTDDWIGMGNLLTLQSNVGFRNSVAVDASASAWAHQLGVTIPEGVGTAGKLILTIQQAGFTGCQLGMIVDRFTSDQSLISLTPTTLGSSLSGLQFTLDPGFEATMTIQVWNSGQTVAAGSSITLLVSYVVPPAQLGEAVERGGFDSRISSKMIGVGPQQVLPLGSVTFIATASAS